MLERSGPTDWRGGLERSGARRDAVGQGLAVVVLTDATATKRAARAKKGESVMSP
jgi:hypothetical protein